MSLAIFKVALLVLFGVAVTNGTLVQIKSLRVNMKPNDYFGDVEHEVNSNGSISIAVPIKKEFDDSFQVKFNITFSDIPIVKDQVIPICEAIASGKKSFLKPILDKIEPKELFPKLCPIPIGIWKINDFAIDTSDYVPIGIIPVGDFEVDIDFGFANQDPIIEVDVTGSLVGSGDLLGIHSSINSLLKLF